MTNFNKLIPKNTKNYIFIGEAGSGKSEISINFAMDLAKNGDKKVHYFDMDMTKPLFRSRDISKELEVSGIEVHYQEQFMDAPTLVGGVNYILKDNDSYVVMDVGGDHIGARAIGGFASILNKENTVVYYVLNSMRPWSDDIEHIDGTFEKILGASHIDLNQIKLIDNSNTGLTTNEKEYIDGCNHMIETVSPYMPIEFSCVNENLYHKVKDEVKLPIVPIHLYLSYDWA